MPNKKKPTRERELDDSDSGSQFFLSPCERQISTHRGACIN
jgi:hypothetical protein